MELGELTRVVESMLALKDDFTQAAEEEIRLTKLLVNACLQKDIKHLVYSALDDLPGDDRVPHCHAKSEGESWCLGSQQVGAQTPVVKYIKSTPLPTTFLYTSTPFSIIHHKELLKKRPKDEHYTLDLPLPDDLALPGYPSEQTGEWAKAAFSKPQRWVGKYCGPRTIHLSCDGEDITEVQAKTCLLAQSIARRCRWQRLCRRYSITRWRRRMFPKRHSTLQPIGRRSARSLGLITKRCTRGESTGLSDGYAPTDTIAQVGQAGCRV